MHGTAAARQQWLGHSLGSAVATHLAATRPERVRSLALHAGWVHTDTRFTAELTLWQHLLATDAKQGTTHFAKMLPLMAFGPRYWAATTASANAALVAELAEFVPPGAPARSRWTWPSAQSSGSWTPSRTTLLRS